MINDTKSAIKQISDIINNSIAPDSATQSTMTKASLVASQSKSNETTNLNATEAPTTTTQPTLTRDGLQKLIRRNVLGLVRLFNIEWNDALNVRQFFLIYSSLLGENFLLNAWTSFAFFFFLRFISSFDSSCSMDECSIEFMRREWD